MLQAKEIGAFLRWLFKGCKTKLKDEIEGNFQGAFLRDYDIENMIIGYLFAIVFVSLVIMFVIL